MKNLPTYLLTALMLLVLACQKEPIAPNRPEISKSVQSDKTPICAWDPCELAIANTKKAYQPFANAICDTVWVDLTCCYGDYETYALVIVPPVRKRCWVAWEPPAP